MASTSIQFKMRLIVTVFLVVAVAKTSEAQLNQWFYSKSCPQLESIVFNTMKQAVGYEPRMGASILRLFFHDCFVNGCDASILLDDKPNFKGEKNALPNQNSVRGFEVIDAIKANVEAACKATVSCADVLALAARDGVVLLGGPYWPVPLGRRDSTSASESAANTNIPPSFADLNTLIGMFKAKGLSARDMTALSGGHSIGYARCDTFRQRLYSDRNIDSSFAAKRRATCPAKNGKGDDNLAPLDSSPTRFDNAYYKNLKAKRGLLHSDQELFNGGSQDYLVKLYSKNYPFFAKDFAVAMIKMGNISPLTGYNGQIRRSCRVVNKSDY